MADADRFPQPAPAAGKAAATVPAGAPPPPPLEYTEPDDAAMPTAPFSLEVIKNGVVVEVLELPPTKTFVTVGRLPICDVPLEHQTISRYHAVIQFHRGDKVTLLDLNSRHGTTLNKQSLPARQHVRWRVGSLARFGESTRLFLLQGPEPTDDDDVDDATARREAARRVAMASALRRQRQEAAEAEAAAAARANEDEGITWGMAEDAVDEDEEQGPRGVAGDRAPERDENGELWFMKDPKKILRNWFEQQGQRLEFEVQEDGPGHARIYTATLRLPIEGAFGERVVASGTAGRKKDAETECAVDACTKLDSKGLLRTDTSISAALAEERRKRMRELFGDQDDHSDDDDFFDRASSERRRQKAEQKKAPNKQQVATFESLSLKRHELNQEQIRLKRDLVEMDRKQAAMEQSAGADDDLDQYMADMKKDNVAAERRKLLLRIVELQKEMTQLDKLIELVRPQGAFFTPPPAPALAPLPPPPAAAAPAAAAPPAADDVKPAERPAAPTAPAPEFQRPAAVPKVATAAPPPRGPARPRPAVDDEEPALAAAPAKVATSPPPAAPSEVPAAKRPRRVFGAMSRAEYEEEAAKDVSDWVPPTDQRGDGRTALNDKLGY